MPSNKLKSSNNQLKLLAMTVRVNCLMADDFLCISMYFCYLDGWDGLLRNEVLFLGKHSSHALFLQLKLVLSYDPFALFQVRPKTGQFLKQKPGHTMMFNEQV